jgi:dipeptidyl aminopeptidase/acylaminoacyl peptidase
MMMSMRRGWLAVMACVLGSATLPAQGPAPARTGPLDVAVFAELPAIEGPSLSPDGKVLAAKFAVEGKQYFSIFSIADASRRLIELGDTDLNWWRWVNDEWLVIGIGKLIPVPGTGEDWYVSRLLAVKADGSKIVSLSPKDAAQNADDLIWAATDGTPRILMGAQTSIYSNDAGFWPRVDMVDVSTGKRQRVLAGRSDVMNWYADGGGTVRMGIGVADEGRSRRVLYRASAKETFRTIDRARRRDDDLLVPSLFLRDPARALMIADDQDGYSALYELDLATLQRGKQLYATPGFDIGGLIESADGYDYIGIGTNGDRPQVQWTDPQMVAMQQAVAGMIRNGSPRIVSLNRDRTVAIVHVGDPSAPGGYYVYRAADNSMQQLSLNNSKLRMKRLNPVSTIRYKARDGLEIAAVLTVPRDHKDGKSRLPLIVMPHGGPFARDTEEWDWWAQFLADRGYLVIQPNYRGSSGYGTNFTRRGEGQWGLAMQDDLNDAVTAMAERGIADPKRVCMVGASYGGYAAMRAAQRDGKLYRCAVAYAGVSDMNRMLQHNRNFLNSGARRDWLKEQAPDLKGVSPLNFAPQFSIPILLAHGKKDRVVPIAQSRLMAQRLREAGKEVTYIEQPLADHHFSRSEDRLEFLKALDAFLAKNNPA